MRVRVDEIPRTGRYVTFKLADAADVAAVALALEAEPSALSGKMHLDRKGAGARVTITGQATIERICDRCQAEVVFDVVVDEVLSYRPVDEVPTAGELELSAKDLDEGFFDGDSLDTADILAEAFALAAPDRVTCAAAPGGVSCELAVSAQETESADDVVGHPAFAVLKKLVKEPR